jgi:hypothetical protein
MKKSLLLGASAAAMLIATPALAQVELRITGGIEFEAGYADEDTDVAGRQDLSDFDFQTESFITFTGQGTADNGLTYGARIDLDDIETNNGVGVDEVSIFLTGGWGTVVLGDDDGAVDNFETDPPTVGNGQVDGSWFDYTQVGTNISYGQINTGDTTKIYYASPSFSGFQVGVSYAPENDGGDNLILDGVAVQGGNGGGPWEDVFEGGATYSGEFDAFNFQIGGTILAGSSTVAGQDDPFAYQIGARGGFGGFTLGVQWYDNTDSFNFSDSWGINAAGTYSVGAWGFGIGYSYGETKLDGNTTTQEDQAAAIGANYAVAPGLSVGADLTWFDTADEGGVTNADSDGWVAVVNTVASF